MEAKALHTYTTTVTIKLLYDHILIWFNCPFTIIINQGTHFINDAICYQSDHFILKHISSTINYLQGSGQTEFINKVFGTLFTILVNENQND